MRRLHSVFCTLAVLTAARADAQSVLERTPNIDRAWTGDTRTAYVSYTHRFAPDGSPGNTPTFMLGYAPPFESTLFGVKYAAHADVAAARTTEWELLVREAFGNSFAMAASYNTAAESIGAEADLSHDFGALSLLSVARWFTSDAKGDRFALGGGAVLRMTSMFALAADVSAPLDNAANEKAAWGAALQIAIPKTPHTLSLQFSNTGSATMEGSSHGGATRVGFEFTAPLRLGKPARVAASQAVPAGATRIVIANNEFQPASITVARGTTVAWQNTDLLPHTATAVDKSWTSPLLQRGDVFTRTFDIPGRYEIVCTPHSYMRMVVNVMN